MKIAVGHGDYLEPDDGPRDSRYHMRIVRIAPASVGYNVTLECGHGVQLIGDPAHCGGVCLCTKCRDLDELV